MTLDHAAGRYWHEHGHRRRDAKDVKRWLTYILKHLDPNMLLADLSAKDVTALVSSLRSACIGEVSINRTVTTLQGLHNRAGKMWEEPTRVIGWRPFKSRERSREAWITVEQAQALLAALPPPTRAVVWFMLLTGVRKREAFELTWDRVQFERGTITIIAKGGIVRDVDLSPEAQLILAQQPRESNSLVFDTTGWRKRFDAARVAAGVPTLRWHDLRHTCATWLGQSGASLDVIRQQLGHSSITVTQKYRHVARSEVRAALHALPTISPTPTNVVPIKRCKSLI